MKNLYAKYRYSLILLRELVKTNFKLRYEGSFLGVLWSALKPIMLFAIMYVVFVHFLRFGADVPHFAVSLLLGIVLWTFFSETTSLGLRSIVDNGGILRKINIPKFVVVVSAAMSALINLGINLVVVLIFAVFNGVEFSPAVLLLIPIILELFVFALAVAFLLSALFVKFRDLTHIWDVVMQGLFYATPIIYPLSMVMNLNPTAAKALLVNPMAQMIQDARAVVVYSGTETVWNSFHNPLFMLAPLVIVAAITVIAILYFRRASKHFTELV